MVLGMTHFRKDPHSPDRGNFCQPEGGGGFVLGNNKYILGHLKWLGGGGTSKFLHKGGWMISEMTHF